MGLGLTSDLSQVSVYDYSLPIDLIAQEPLPRGQSRLMAVNRDSGEIEVGPFNSLLTYLQPGDVLVLNDTRVSAIRLLATSLTGQPVELFLLKSLTPTRWEAMVKPGRKFSVGRTVTLLDPNGSPFHVTVVDSLDSGSRLIEFDSAVDSDRLAKLGNVPLPPYIHHKLDDPERYQTIYNQTPGSAAAPTAGLHFTANMIAQVKNLGVEVTFVTLHVGIDTFRPVKVESIAEHKMHGERWSIPNETADHIRNRKGRVIAVGTTTVRTLESACNDSGNLLSGSGNTQLFITPGFQFRIVDAILTNFHLPKSTLLMMMCAFGGYDTMMGAYRRAIEERMRFYSFGDAMLIFGGRNL